MNRSTTQNTRTLFMSEFAGSGPGARSTLGNTMQGCMGGIPPLHCQLHRVTWSVGVAMASPHSVASVFKNG